MLKAPDDVIAAHSAEQEHIQGKGGGANVAVTPDALSSVPLRALKTAYSKMAGIRPAIARLCADGDQKR